MHRLLRSQIAKATEPSGSVDIDRLVELVGNAYSQFDMERARTDRSMRLMMSEVDALAKERNSAIETLGEQNRQLSALSESLERRVVERTAAAEQAVKASQFANLQLLAEIRERQSAQDRLRASNEALQRATQAKSSFLATMSHEIRTPMNGVLGMADLLSRTRLTTQQQRLVNTINQSASTLLTIINDILDLSRIEAGKLEIDVQDFDLHECIESVIEVFAREVQKKRLDLCLMMPGNIPRFVRGDAARLRQVLTNLLGNAIKFTHQGEIAVRVALEGEKNGSHVVGISVRDTGIGVDASAKALLFQPFSQADNSITRRFGGTGLGLSITRHLVQLMGGDVVLESELGKGTTVNFTIRLDKSARSEIPAPVSSTAIRGQRILVVDDRAINHEIVCSYLADCGAIPETAGSAEQALTLMHKSVAEQRPYGLVILDMILPGLNGLELAKRIKADPAIAGTQLIMLTSLSWQADSATAREAGIAGFLRKPIRRGELLDEVRRCLAAPIADVPRQPPETSPRQPQKALNGLRVLVAEDNPVNQEVIREYVSLLGCEVHIAEHGGIALASFARERFDIVLMDCQMPEMDGLTACRKIRELERLRGLERTPVIAVTANAYDSDRAMCLAAEMDDFMSKPFTSDQLEALLTKWAPRTEDRKAEADPKTADASDAAEEQRQQTLVFAKLLEFEACKTGMASRLCDLFLATGLKSAEQIMAAVAEGDITRLRMAAHSLKSSGANIGAQELSRLAARLEAQARDGESMPSCLMTATLVEAELRAVVGALHASGWMSELKRAG